MSLNPSIRDQAYEFFIEEAQELLQVLEDGLLNLQQDHSTPKVHELMRAAHSIKGGAASVELDAIKTLAHRLEDFFKALYSEKVTFDDELEGLLLQAYDCLRNPLTEQMEEGAFNEENAILTADPIFSQLQTILGEALEESDNYIPSATDLGVDIVESIFEVDVAQSLDTLSQVVDNPQNCDVLGELQNQVEVLGGFAELFGLSGFTEIIELTRLAIQNNSDRSLDIVQALLNDCRITRKLVLEGDRIRGGEPSAALLALAESNTTTAVNESTQNEWSLFPSTPDDGENLSFDDIFGGNLESPIAEIPPIDTPPGEENIFADIGDSAILEQEAPETIETDPNLDLFAVVPPALEIPDNSSTESITSDERDIVASDGSIETPSLDDVFGAAIEDSGLDFPDFAPETTPSEAQEDFAPPENLDSAVESIGQIFEKLPPLTAQPVSAPVEITKKSNKQDSDKASGSNLSVRVDLDRLERMNNLIGELVINRNSLSLQNEQLQNNIGELNHKLGRFRNITGKLREFSDRMLIDSERSEVGKQQQQSSNPGDLKQIQNNSELSEESMFDSLEMDSYSNLHLLLQEILDEVLQLEESMDDIFLFAQQSDKTIDVQRQMLGQMRDELMWARMLPLEKILKRFPRTLRDLSSKYKKPVNLEMFGTGVLVDKAVLEKLYDPLLHLFRNGFDHGIETPEVRRKKGKPEKGRIEIHAYYQGNQTVIDIKDDGQGLDLDKIAQKALKKGLIAPEKADTASEQELFGLIFEPGFSTADRVSEISGRGVGMSVVRSQIESLKGTITVSSTPDKGSTFSLRLPLTLTIAKLLVFSLGITAFAIPSDSIEEIIIPLPEQIKLSGGQRLFFWQDTLIPICDLKGMLPYNCPLPPMNQNSKVFDSVSAPEDWELPLLLIRRGQKLFALEIEKLITEQELVIKPFGKAMAAPSYTYGCTILGDGTLIPVINGATLLDDFWGTEKSSITSTSSLQTKSEVNLNTNDQESILTGSVDSNFSNQTIHKTTQIMVIDDSTALRRTMALSLQNQGYAVVQAKDGQDAMKQLRNQLEIDLIVCDVEMPNMNGFEFLDLRRRDANLKKIPVIMLTSRSGKKHRNLASQLGANAYFTKPYIEQEFLKELNKILSPA